MTQKQQDIDQVIVYASKTLKKRHLNYTATKRELYAILRFTHYFRNFLLVRKTLIVTAHRSLTWFYSFKEQDGIIARRLENLGQLKFETKHKAVKKNPNEDCLSGLPTTTEEVVNQIRKTTDVTNNICEQALKTPNLELQRVQLKSNEIRTAKSWEQKQVEAR